MPSVRNILAIDNEPLLLRSLALILQRAGYRVTTATSAREARQYFQTDRYDLALLDLKMPEVDGLSLLHEIHVYQPGMPVLILTAQAGPDSAMEAMLQGAYGYLVKPIAPEAILARVRNVLAEE
jgi:DNA-binding response OmpR family regulator